MGVGVDHEDGQVSGVQQDRIGRLGAYAVDAEQLLPKCGQIGAEHGLQGAVIPGDQQLQ